MAADAGPSVPAGAMHSDVSIVVPVYSNADTLEELHRRLCAVLEPVAPSFEIVFVDDACPAGSLAVLEALARCDRRVAVIVHERNAGQYRAVMTGLAHARGGCAVVLDADLQDPPEAVPQLLARLREGYGAVFAGRRGRYEGFSRRLTSRLFKTLLHLVAGTPVDAGLFVALSREMIDRLLAYNERRPFVVAMIGCTGLSLASVPVVRLERPAGWSAYSSWKRLTTGCNAILWVLGFRSRLLLGRRAPHHAAPAVPVRAYIGARFATPAAQADAGTDRRHG
jgi:glycosyltransferase involved in cell wall biosynthesis